MSGRAEAGAGAEGAAGRGERGSARRPAAAGAARRRPAGGHEAGRLQADDAQARGATAVGVVAGKLEGPRGVVLCACCSAWFPLLCDCRNTAAACRGHAEDRWLESNPLTGSSGPL